MRALGSKLSEPAGATASASRVSAIEAATGVATAVAGSMLSRSGVPSMVTAARSSVSSQ
jgi:hypothetical protein